jgi:hypothetical protein
MWYQNKTRGAWSSDWGNPDKPRVGAVSKSSLALVYTRTSKERRKGNPATPTTLSLYTIRLPPSNYSSCSDVPSKSHSMFLNAISSTSYPYNHTISSDFTTPQSTSLSEQIIPPPSPCFLRVSWGLRLSVTHFLLHPLHIPPFIPNTSIPPSAMTLIAFSHVGATSQ